MVVKMLKKIENQKKKLKKLENFLNFERKSEKKTH